MAIFFADKLSILLAISGTKNKDLADALYVDCSQISRMRKGVRGKPSKSDTIYDMAKFFAEKCVDSDQRISALNNSIRADRLRMGEVSLSVLSDTIFEWLNTDADDLGGGAGVGSFLESADKFVLHKNIPYADFPLQEKNKNKVDTEECRVFFGNEGKRQALQELLMYLTITGKPGRIRFFIDEALAWISENPEYKDMCIAKLYELAKKGCTIQLFMQNQYYSYLGDIFFLFEVFLPLFVQGSCQIMFFDGMRDEIFKKTMIVVPGQIAMTCSMIGDNYDKALTTLTTGQNIVADTSFDLDSIEKLCRPIAKTYSIKDLDKVYSLIETASLSGEKGLQKCGALSIPTIPEIMLKRIESFGHIMFDKQAASFRRRRKARLKVLETSKVTDIIYLPPFDTILNDELPFPGARPIPGITLYYYPQEYLAHLETILSDLKKYPNYNVVISDTDILPNIIVDIKGDNTTIIREAAPFSVFEFMSSRATASFKEYLIRKTADFKLPREQTIEKIEDTILRFKEALDEYAGYGTSQL